MLDTLFASEPGLIVRNFKSFGEGGAHLDRIARLNVVIGKNNSGKSAILDAVDLLCRGDIVGQVHYHHGERPSLRIRQVVGQQQAALAFPPKEHGQIIGGYWRPLTDLLAKSVVHADLDGRLTGGVTFDLDQGFEKVRINDRETFKARLGKIESNIKSPFSGLKVVRVAAERNLQPEVERTEKVFSSNGTGLVGLLAHLITSASERSAVVEEEFRKELNTVLEPDIRVSAIRTYKQDTGAWEIYFAGDKGPIAMSDSGSGLKTVVQTLAALWLMPRLGVYKVQDCIFLFEELENNLHPALQRRLLNYIWDSLDGKGCAFLATHSSVAIDLFNRNPDAQIIHVTHANGEARAVTAHTTVSHGDVVDDLDVRASDILQSNCIVWVEGPSDRIYFNRWMGLVTNDALVEGAHYQCLFYGGRLLSHLSAEYGEEDAVESVRILRANRHAILLMDSDRANADMPLNGTKTRVKAEIEAIGGYAWVTNGREIENDIGKGAFARLDARLSSGLKPFAEVEKVIQTRLPDIGKRLTQSKAVLAGRLAPLIDEGDIGAPLRAHLEACAKLIRKWNGLG